MRGFVVIKNLKSPLEDVSVTDDIPEKNIDYTLIADVSLLEKRVKQVEPDDEDEDITFIFQPTGRISLVKSQPNDTEPRETHSLVDGHLVTNSVPDIGDTGE